MSKYICPKGARRMVQMEAALQETPPPTLSDSASAGREEY
jgi:hypothetical protein